MMPWTILIYFSKLRNLLFSFSLKLMVLIARRLLSPIVTFSFMAWDRSAMPSAIHLTRLANSIERFSAVFFVIYISLILSDEQNQTAGGALFPKCISVPEIQWNVKSATVCYRNSAIKNMRKLNRKTHVKHLSHFTFKPKANQQNHSNAFNSYWLWSFR